LARDRARIVLGLDCKRGRDNSQQVRLDSGTVSGHFADYLPEVHALHLNVLAFDFRGHGTSAGHTEMFIMAREVQDLLAAEAFLRRRRPSQPPFLVGVSYGAAVALQPLPHLPQVRGVWCEICFGRLSTVLERKFDCTPACLRSGLVSLYTDLAWVDCGFLEPDINPITRLDSLRVPICFCDGCDDELVPFAEALYERNQGPKSHYWVAHPTHSNVRQQAGAEYANRLCAFLEANE
jgi:hypothetical protein